MVSSSWDNDLDVTLWEFNKSFLYKKKYLGNQYKLESGDYKNQLAYQQIQMWYKCDLIDNLNIWSISITYNPKDGFMWHK